MKQIVNSHDLSTHTHAISAYTAAGGTRVDGIKLRSLTSAILFWYTSLYGCLCDCVSHIKLCQALLSALLGKKHPTSFLVFLTEYICLGPGQGQLCSWTIAIGISHSYLICMWMQVVMKPDFGLVSQVNYTPITCRFLPEDTSWWRECVAHEVMVLWVIEYSQDTSHSRTEWVSCDPQLVIL